jgi:hypothetical protein
MKCDCGNPKIPDAEACERCEYLDGHAAEGAIIATLRTIGRATPTELAEYTGYVRNYLQHVLKRLRDRGRVGRTAPILEIPDGVTYHNLFRTTKRPIVYYYLKEAR